jgi:hypothetical protein
MFRFKTSLQTPKGQSEAIYLKTDGQNRKNKRTENHLQSTTQKTTMVYEPLHRKLEIEPHEPCKNRG